MSVTRTPSQQGGPKNDFTATAADPTSTTDNTLGWSAGSEILASSGKLWQCLSAATNAAVWACINGPVPQADNASASVTIADTDDGGQLRLTHATPTVTWPNTLRPGHTVELIAWGATTVITLASGGGGNLTIRIPPSRTLVTVEQYDAVTVTVHDSTDALARGDLGP